MTRAEGLIDLLDQQGLVTSKQAALSVATEYLKRDYIPGGHRAKRIINIRPAPVGHRCGFQICVDVQSGPIFCGEPATLIADDPDNPGDIALSCKEHERDFHKFAER